MGLSGELYCHSCREHALSMPDEKDKDRLFGESMICLFYGSIDIDEVRAFLDKHEKCGKDMIVFDIS